MLVQTSEGRWETQTVSVFDAVFGEQNAAGANATGFAQAADDKLQIIEFIHDYEVPAPTTGAGG